MIFLAHRIKAQKFRGKFRSIFREKFRAPKKIFRANFVLQTCHPNDMGYRHDSIAISRVMGPLRRGT